MGEMEDFESLAIVLHAGSLGSYVELVLVKLIKLQVELAAASPRHRRFTSSPQFKLGGINFWTLL